MTQLVEVHKRRHRRLGPLGPVQVEVARAQTDRDQAAPGLPRQGAVDLATSASNMPARLSAVASALSECGRPGRHSVGEQLFFFRQ